MSPARRTPPHARPCRLALPGLVAVAAALGGCQHLPSGLLGDAQRSLQRDETGARAPVVLAPAPRPTLRVGDSFIFGRGSVRTVSAVAPDAITWRNASAAPGDEVLRYRTSPDLFAPVLDQPSRADAPVSRITDREGSLWPLQAGRRASFDERRRATPGAPERRLRWTCEVGSPRMVSVPAGDFATYPVTCSARQDPMPLATQVLTWDYAPSLGHYVRRSWLDNGRQRETVLSAALPAELATPERIARVVQRLQAAP